MDNLLQKYLNSVLNPDEFSRFSDYLADETHAESVNKAYKELWQKESEGVAELPEVNKVLIQKIILAIQTDEIKEARKKINFIAWGLRIAAVLIIGLVLGSLFLFRKLDRTDLPDYAQTISIPTGARTSFSLPDESRVWLNSGSSLTFPSRFDETRPVTLKGEAFFEVVKSDIPFIVTTSSAQVKVTGTSFNVNAFEGAGFETTLVSGSITIRGKDDKEEVVLKPGEQVILADGKWEVQQVETELFTSWKEGRLIFRKEYLPAVAERLERWYNVKIELSNDARLQKIWYTGTLEMESFSEVLDLLKVTAPIEYTYNDKTRIIKITYRE